MNLTLIQLIVVSVVVGVLVYGDVVYISSYSGNLPVVSKAYAERAAMLRDQYGAPLVDDETTVLSVGFARADGYADAYAELTE